MTALFREGDYVLTDLTYTTVGRRILYFKASSLKDSDVEETRLTGHPARTTVRLMPRQGPGEEYDNVMETKKQDLSNYEFTDITSYSLEDGEWITYTGWIDYDTGIFISDPKTERYLVCLNENAPLSVFFETDGWVFAEFGCSLGTVRAWLPANCVAAE